MESQRMSRDGETNTGWQMDVPLSFPLVLEPWLLDDDFS